MRGIYNEAKILNCKKQFQAIYIISCITFTDHIHTYSISELIIRIFDSVNFSDLQSIYRTRMRAQETHKVLKSPQIRMNKMNMCWLNTQLEIHYALPVITLMTLLQLGHLGFASIQEF